MYGEEEKARELGLHGRALRAHRRKRISPIAKKFERWLSAVKPSLLPSEPLMAAVQYYLWHRDALFRFIDDPELPIDNSATEREFQNVAKLRLNMLFAGSTEGAHRACVLLGIVATCRALRVPVEAYLAWAFDRLGTHRDVYGLALEDTTPAAFKKPSPDLLTRTAPRHGSVLAASRHHRSVTEGRPVDTPDAKETKEKRCREIVYHEAELEIS